jgi:hypothetical protein
MSKRADLYAAMKKVTRLGGYGLFAVEQDGPLNTVEDLAALVKDRNAEVSGHEAEGGMMTDCQGARRASMDRISHPVSGGLLCSCRLHLVISLCRPRQTT